MRTRSRETTAVLAFLVMVLPGISAAASSILFAYVGTDYYADGQNLVSKLVAGGHIVTQVDLWGTVVGGLSSYDQIWVYDLATGSNAGANQIANYTNIANWYNSLTNKNVILDGRIVSSADSWTISRGGKPSETGLVQRYASVLEERSGGLVLGTDHAPDYTQGINEINRQIGFAAFSGFYYTAPLEAVIDTASSLCDGTFGFACSDGSSRMCINDNSSTSFAPTGLQANGQTLTPFAYHGTISQAWDNAAISTSFDSPTFPTVPVPGAIALVGLGFGCVGWMRRRRTP